MRKLSRRLLNDVSGATAVEYALLGSIIVLLIVSTVTGIGTQLSNEFSEVSGMYK